MCVYIYIYICTHVCLCIYWSSRRERGDARDAAEYGCSREHDNNTTFQQHLGSGSGPLLGARVLLLLLLVVLLLSVLLVLLLLLINITSVITSIINIIIMSILLLLLLLLT